MSLDFAESAKAETIACQKKESWVLSSLERKICSSTGQAETYAMVSAVKETEWERLLLSELGEPQLKATVLRSDNSGVVSQSTKQVNHTTAKHCRISQAYIRNRSGDEVIEVVKVSSENNCSDIFTKPLPADAFIRHRRTIMGPQSPDDI
jgi:hypothetical protein